jgi:hypothetical protein
LPEKMTGLRRQVNEEGDEGKAEGRMKNEE